MKIEKLTSTSALFSLFAGASLLFTAVPAITHAQTTNDCAPTPDTVDPNVLIVHITDTCPLTAYHMWETVATGEYDGSTLDYVRVGVPLAKTPQMKEEIEAVIPSSPTFYGLDPVNGGTALTAEAYTVMSRYLQSPNDAAPPYGHWTQAPPPPDIALTSRAFDESIVNSKQSDACGPIKVNSATRQYRLVLVTDTCTDTTFPRVAEKAVPSYSVGGSQFASTANGGLWLTAATASRDDGNAEILFLIPVGRPDDLGGVPTQSSIPYASDAMGFVKSAVYGGKVQQVPPEQQGHDFYVTWEAGGGQ